MNPLTWQNPEPVELAKDIFWIGAVDYNKRNFHGYSRSPRGTTYNSYLVRDEKNVVFDTVEGEGLLPGGAAGRSAVGGSGGGRPGGPGRHHPGRGPENQALRPG